MSGWPLRVAMLAALGCLALSGTAPLVAATIAIVAVTFPRRWGERNWLAGHVCAIAVSGGVAWGVGVVEGFSVFIAWLSIHRAWSGSGPADQRVALLLAALMVLLACVAAVSPLLAPLLALFAGSAPIALLRSQGAEGRRLEFGVGMSTGFLTLAFFLLLPRMQAGMLAEVGRAGRPAFPEDIELGDDFSNDDDAALVMRLRARTRAGLPRNGPFYLRGRTLDRFDGRRWTATDTPPNALSGRWDVATEILLEPIEDDVLFGPPEVLSVDGLPGARFTPAGWVYPGAGRRIQYTARSRDVPLGPILGRGDAWLELPPLDPRVAALIESISPGETDPLVLVGAMTAFLREGFAYTETPPAPTGDPLAWFLLDSRLGHCEYYATALAVMLRSRDVPARLATGFYTAETSDLDGWVSVRRGHAHAWVEVPTAAGWAVLDATPTSALPAPEIGPLQATAEALATAWNRFVLDYDLDAQLDGLAVLGSAMVDPIPGDGVRTRGRQGFAGFGIAIVALALAGTIARLVIRQLSRERNVAVPADDLARAWRAARRQVRRLGWQVPDSLPPVSAGEWLVEHAGEPGRPLLELAWLDYRVRYGGIDVAGVQAEARRLVRAVQQLPRAG